MSLRVVVYAEGTGELAGEWLAPPAPGDQLHADQQGPAHILAARSIELARGVPVGAVRFEKGLRKVNAAEPRGSDLLRKKTLLQLLDWPLADIRPELALVFVDEDDVGDRHAMMREWIAELKYGRPPAVIAVARQEFESWLVTDLACVTRVLGRPFGTDGDPEGWSPKAAKQLLQRAIDDSNQSNRTRTLRREICAQCDLAELKRRSRSFGRFLGELATA